MTDDKPEAARDEGDYPRNIISRDEAKRLGLKRFFTGEPCKHGHIAERNARSGRCLECDRAHHALEEVREKDRGATASTVL